MPFEIEELPFEKDALEPYISARTVEVHYEKHHKGYFEKLNQIVKGTPDEKRTLTEIVAGGPEKAGKGVYNVAAQAWNHTFYWNCLSPTPEPSEERRVPGPKMTELIEKNFASFELLRKEFTEKAAAHFGCGWVWLVKDPDLDLVQVWEGHDAASPIAYGYTPLLVIDIWEHAYYLDYQNRKADYIEGWWNVVNWDFVEKQITK